jgi:hypothetical protein
VEPFDFQAGGWFTPDYSGSSIQSPEEISPERFMASVAEVIASDGVWQAVTEYRMGGGTTVTIEEKPRGKGTSYRAIASWGSLDSSGEYDSLEHALRGLPLLSLGLYDVRNRGGWKGLVSG